MDGYYSVNLKKAISLEEVGESTVQSVLSDFSCPYNKDVETFIRQKAILFAKNGWAQTHLIFTSFKKKPVLVGFYTLSIKCITISSSVLSKTMRKRLGSFAAYNADTKKFILPTPLIAQLSKNFANGYNKLITGDELLKEALKKVKEIQMMSSGKFTYVECEDEQKLIEFYSRNGFVNVGTRMLDHEELSIMKGEYLVQMIKYIHDNA